MKKILTVFVLSLLACACVFAGCKPPVTQEPTVYSVTYNLDGGRIEGEYRTSYSAEDAFTLPVPVKENYEFVCWTDANGKEWTEIKNQVGNKTFFANWRQIVFSITYDLAGGVNSPDNPDSYSSKGETITLSAPAREGYKFLGWRDKNAVGGDFVAEISSGSTGDKVFVAIWEKASFSITYELDGGTNHPDNPDSYESDSADIELKAPTKEGYIFLGWIDAATSGTTFVDKIPAGSKGDKIFVAKWRKEVPPEAETFVVKYELVYNGQRSTVENAADVLDAEIKDGEAFNGLLPEAVSENPLYRFDGWVVITAEGEIRITAGTIADEALLGEDGETITLVAKVVRYAYAIEYVLEYDGITSTVNGHDTVENDVIAIDGTFEGKLFTFVPTDAHYKATKWVAIVNGNETEITAATAFSAELLGEDGETITLVAKVVRYAYAIEYVLEYDGITSTVNGHDTVENDVIAIDGTFEGKLFTFVPTDAHYKATKWVAIVNGNETEITAATAFSAELLGEDGETVRLYAKAERYKYDVKYELNYGGVASAVNGATALEDGIIAMGESFADKLFTFVPTTEGYVAEGWVVLVNGQEAKLNSASVLTAEMLEADGSAVRLYAKAVYRQVYEDVTIAYNLTDTIQREYQSNNKGTFIDFKEYGKPLTVDGKTTAPEKTVRNGESFAGKLPAIDQENCGWVYKTTEGYVYCSEKTVFDLSKAVLEDGKLVLYACLTEYWIGPY